MVRKKKTAEVVEVAETSEETSMTKREALVLIGEYCEFLRSLPMISAVEHHASGMADRFPEDGSVGKAFRWLGYLQGVLVSHARFSLEDVKNHSMNRTIL